MPHLRINFPIALAALLLLAGAGSAEGSSIRRGATAPYDVVAGTLTSVSIFGGEVTGTVFALQANTAAAARVRLQILGPTGWNRGASLQCGADDRFDPAFVTGAAPSGPGVCWTYARPITGTYTATPTDLSLPISTVALDAMNVVFRPKLTKVTATSAGLAVAWADGSPAVSYAVAANSFGPSTYGETGAVMVPGSAASASISAQLVSGRRYYVWIDSFPVDLTRTTALTSPFDMGEDWKTVTAPGPQVPGVRDGRLAYTFVVSGRSGIASVNADGSVRTVLSSPSAFDAEPAWSRDGGRIAYVCGNFAICVMNADGSHKTAITDTGPWNGRFVYDLHPTWSADGGRIAFASNRGGSWDIWVVDTNGSGLKRVEMRPGEDNNPDWSRSGTRIVFDGTDNLGQQAIYSINANGTGLKELTGVVTDDATPRWSPDGSQVLLARGSDLLVVSPDGIAKAPLPASGLMPAWSADGSKIAYVRAGHLLEASPDGTNATRVNTGPGVVRFPHWQPVGVPASPPALGSGHPPIAASGDALLIGDLRETLRDLFGPERPLILVRANHAPQSAAAQRAAAGLLHTLAQQLTHERPQSAIARKIQRLALTALSAKGLFFEDLAKSAHATTKRKSELVDEALKADGLFNKDIYAADQLTKFPQTG